MRVFRDEELKYSQNFLYNKNLVNKLVKISNLDVNDIVIEIGAGKGIITEILSKNVSKVIAFEKDNVLFKRLKLNLQDIENVELLNEDILKYNFSKNSDYKIFSNIPFNITTDIISRILSIDIKPTDMFLIMQKETANRFIGNPYSKESLKSILLKMFYDIKIIYRFNRTDFKPVPSVDIVFVHFSINSKLEISDINLFKDFASYLFMLNENTIKTKLKRLFTYNQIKNISKQININNKITKLTFENWLYLLEVFKTKASISSKQLIKGYYDKYIKVQSRLEKIYRSRK